MPYAHVTQTTGTAETKIIIITAHCNRESTKQSIKMWKKDAFIGWILNLFALHRIHIVFVHFHILLHILLRILSSLYCVFYLYCLLYTWCFGNVLRFPFHSCLALLPRPGLFVPLSARGSLVNVHSWAQDEPFSQVHMHTKKACIPVMTSSSHIMYFDRIWHVYAACCMVSFQLDIDLTAMTAGPRTFTRLLQSAKPFTALTRNRTHA